MQNHIKVKAEFNKKLEEFHNEAKPALYGNVLKEMVIYEKLIEIQDQLNKLEKRLGHV